MTRSNTFHPADVIGPVLSRRHRISSPCFAPTEMRFNAQWTVAQHANSSLPLQTLGMKTWGPRGHGIARLEFCKAGNLRYSRYSSDLIRGTSVGHQNQRNQLCDSPACQPREVADGFVIFVMLFSRVLLFFLPPF